MKKKHKKLENTSLYCVSGYDFKRKAFKQNISSTKCINKVYKSQMQRVINSSLSLKWTSQSFSLSNSLLMGSISTLNCSDLVKNGCCFLIGMKCWRQIFKKICHSIIISSKIVKYQFQMHLRSQQLYLLLIMLIFK